MCWKIIAIINENARNITHKKKMEELHEGLVFCVQTKGEEKMMEEVQK
jgi:hypothetical protein